MPEAPIRGLRQLARLYRIETSYTAVGGERRAASPEALLGVLRALGAPVEGAGDVAAALRARRRALATRLVDPVAIAWKGRPAFARISLPEGRASARLDCRVVLEDGEPRAWRAIADRLDVARVVDHDGGRVVHLRLPLPDDLPTGYHRLTIRTGRTEGEGLVIAAAAKVSNGREGDRKPLWGVFCPLYALHQRRSWGAGDFADMEALMDWTAEMGGGLVATLPMLASFLDDPVSHSPYSPASRLFWNELYLDLDRLPELARCERARALLASRETRAEIEALRADPLVDYTRLARLKRPVIDALADWFFAHEAKSSDDYQRFLRAHPDVEEYAFFQAAGERFGRAWRDWPEALRGADRLGQVDERARRYHLYAQWRTDRQLAALSDRARQSGLTWYVDLPVGVHPLSYDAWREPGAFASGATVGCPPDPTFTRGQDWGFPPPHPDGQRDAFYGYPIAALRAQLRHAGALRIDHVMGLHRLYWIPQGQSAGDGAYVRYPAEELYAIFSVESHRRGAWLVGENLGTVPPDVDRALRRHRVRGMYVLQYEHERDRAQGLRTVPRPVVASVNTHDMPPFAAFWEGRDIDDRVALGLHDEQAAAREHQARASARRAVVRALWDLGWLRRGESDLRSVLLACWSYLAASPADALLLNIEDLWLETEPQNTPNTFRERPNWRRKLRERLEDLARQPEYVDTLKNVAALRRASAERARHVHPRDLRADEDPIEELAS